MLAEGIPRRTMMRRAAATAGGCAAEPHLLCTTISTQDETVARHKSQALKSERALCGFLIYFHFRGFHLHYQVHHSFSVRSLAVSANSTAGNNGSNALVGDEAGNSAGLRANQLKVCTFLHKYLVMSIRSKSCGQLRRPWSGWWRGLTYYGIG